MTPEPSVESLRQEEADRLRTQKGAANRPVLASRRLFRDLGEDRYILTLPDAGIELEIDRLRRDRHELIGELAVRCALPGARTIVESGTLSIADFNVSSARARTDRAKLLAGRATTRDLDWTGILEDFCQRVLVAERTGQPAVDLRELPPPSHDNDVHDVLGLTLPRRHPSILFGDGGSCKSYVALHYAGLLAEQGVAVALFDWELAGDDHRDRLERLFPDGMPKILYARCERPLVHEVDRLRRIVRDNGIQFSIFDSVAFAADGPPEAAEVAGRYFRAVRQIGGGSLHVAHISKAEGADKKPFGSAFWHNGARSTWFVQLDDSSANSNSLTLGLFNRKANLGRLCSPLGLNVIFGADTTVIRRTDIAASPDLAINLTTRQRMAYLLRVGAMGPDQIAEEIDATSETVARTARRYKEQFIVLEGGKIGLLSKH